MFRGITNISLDDKGRIGIPSRYRDIVRGLCEGNVVLTIDPHQPCLQMFPLPDWEKLQEKLLNLPPLQPGNRRLQRLLLGHASDQKMDGNGRVSVAPILRDYAKIEKGVTLLGQGRWFELWSDSVWEAQCTRWIEEERASDEGMSEALQAFTY
ncbi:MAG: division/cell wall cluster transcriptional repressor MraZ [Pseudomonadota bacterium]|nr:division/cell wall cluster transcriptional repressor MraZ [Pseudomonadota bacterium]